MAKDLKLTNGWLKPSKLIEVTRKLKADGFLKKQVKIESCPTEMEDKESHNASNSDEEEGLGNKYSQLMADKTYLWRKYFTK